MEPIAIEFVFHTWDMDVCTSLLQNGANSNEECEPAAGELKMPDEHG